MSKPTRLSKISVSGWKNLPSEKNITGWTTVICVNSPYRGIIWLMVVTHATMMQMWCGIRLRRTSLQSETRVRADAAWADGEREDMSTFRFLALGHYHVPGGYGVGTGPRTGSRSMTRSSRRRCGSSPRCLRASRRTRLLSHRVSSPCRGPLPGRTNKAAYVLMRVDESNLDRVEICFRENMYDWTTYRDTLSSWGIPSLTPLLKILSYVSVHKRRRHVRFALGMKRSSKRHHETFFTRLYSNRMHGVALCAAWTCTGRFGR